jgi:hypothetical protein
MKPGPQITKTSIVGCLDPDGAWMQSLAVWAQERSAFADQSPAFKIWALVVLFAWRESHYRHL